MRNSQRLLKEEKQLLTEYEEEINQEQNGKILPELQLRRAQQKRSSMLHGHTWADTPPFSTALYKGQLVALKRIYKHYEKQVRDEIKKELLEVCTGFLLVRVTAHTNLPHSSRHAAQYW